MLFQVRRSVPAGLKLLAAFIDDLSIKTKLLFCFLLFSIVLVASVGIVIYNRSSEVINKQSSLYSETILKQNMERIEKLRDEIMRISIPVVTNPNLQKNDLNRLDAIEYLNRKRSIESSFSSITAFRYDICSIYACFGSGSIFSPNPVSQKDELRFRNYYVYSKAIEAKTKPVWTGVHENEFAFDSSRYILTFSRSLYDEDRFQPLGVLVINISNQVFMDICMGDSDRGKYNIIIIDREGKIIFDSCDENGIEGSGREYLSSVSRNGGETGSFEWNLGDTPYKVTYVTPSKSDWTYIAEVPSGYLLENSKQVQKYVYMILIISILMSSMTAYIISSYFTVPLRKMIRTMKKVECGDINVSLDIRNKSETGQLSASFNRMIQEIQNLIRRIDQEHMQKREAELNVLQAQITPHFLYNTLNSIKCLAHIQKAEGIKEMTASLIELLQISVSKKTVMISIREEIEIVKKYILLQNFRFGNKITVTYNLEEEILDYKTIKLILQPLVENSILHGINTNQTQGVIVIAAYRKEEEICMEVKDNGMGMDEEKIRTVLGQDSYNTPRFSGIGVKNINERIKMHFGETYGLSFTSIPGQFTLASVIIPAIAESEVAHYV